jgi:hypothetical protein
MRTPSQTAAAADRGSIRSHAHACALCSPIAGRAKPVAPRLRFRRRGRERRMQAPPKRAGPLAFFLFSKSEHFFKSEQKFKQLKSKQKIQI